MTLIHEVDFPNALSEYCRTNGASAIVDDENCWQLHPTQQQLESGNDRIGYTNVGQFDWNHPSLAKPTANQLITAHDTFVAATLTSDTTESTIKTAQNGLKNKIALAEQFATSITAVLNVSLQQTEDATTQPTRFNNIKAVMDAQPAAFRNRFNGDLLQEAEITIGSIVAGQFPAYCRYVRAWSTQLALLLVIRKAVS